MTDHTDPYPERVLALEAEGMTTSDAQAVADAELMGAKPLATPSGPGRPPRRKRSPRECACGCRGMAKGGTYRPGHDARHHAALKSVGKKSRLIVSAAGKPIVSGR